MTSYMLKLHRQVWTVPRATTLVLLIFPLLAYSLDETTPLNPALHHISGARMMSDIATLSSGEFNGRQTGTEDDLRSARWVADQFRASQLNLAEPPSDRFNLTPGLQEHAEPPTGFMTKPLKTAVIASAPTLQTSDGRTSHSQQLGTDFLPILDSPTAHVSAPIVFVGYGIVDAAFGVNDYAGIECTNCIVLFLRGKPDHYNGTVTHADKVRVARQKGAIAYLTATGPILNSYERRRGVTGQPSAYYSLSPESDTLPGAWISTSQAEYLLASTEPLKREALRTIQAQLNDSPASRSFRTDHEGLLEWESRRGEGLLINVAATLPGTDLKLKDETVVIGAHRDHFGSQAGLLFPGADDNASGTAVMLEVARGFAKLPAKPKRTLLFLSFSGEERGLLGSRLYVDQPLAPLSSIKAMINVDHAGIGNGRLTVGVSGSDKSLVQEAGQRSGLADRLDLFGFFPGGDHVPFKEAGVPTVTVVSGGIHPQFHLPTDTVETINQDVLTAAARYVFTLAWQLANQS